MDAYLRDLLVKKWNIGKFSFSFLDALLAVCITGTGVMLRLSVIGYTATDWDKISAMILEFLLAVWGGMIVYFYTGARLRAFLTYAVLVIYPSIIANSALWNRGSVFYAWFFLLSLYLLVKGARVRAGLSAAAGAVIALSRMRVSTQNLTLGWPNLYEIVGKSMFVDLYNRVSLLVLAGLLLTGIYLYIKKKVNLTGP